jgi:hypothetical protein
MTAEEITALEYVAPKQLPATGEWAALRRMFYTVGLFVGIDETGYRTRFCYPTMLAALVSLAEWDGSGDPPGPWIKEKGRNERNNPATFKGLPIFEESAEIDPAVWGRL